MQWVIETAESGSALVEAARRHGDTVIEVDQKDRFTKEYKEYLDEGVPTIFHGSLGFAASFSRENYWPGAICTERNFWVHNYNLELLDLLVNRYAMRLRFDQIESHADYLFGAFGVDGHIFIRPDSPWKPFTGQLIHREGLGISLKTIGSQRVAPSEIVWVSRPRYVLHEIRFVVVDDVIVTGSTYLLDGAMERRCVAPPYFAEARMVADQATQLYRPDDAYIIDVGFVEGHWEVVELNAFSTSGLYECDCDAIVGAIGEHYA